MKKLWLAFWFYWKWVCVALMTSFALLALIAGIVTFFKSRPADKTPIEHCIDSGGAWDEDEGACKTAA